MIEELARRHRRMLTSPVFWPQLWAPPCILPSISFFICELKGQTPTFDEEEIREQRDTSVVLLSDVFIDTGKENEFSSDKGRSLRVPPHDLLRTFSVSPELSVSRKEGGRNQSG